MAGLVIIALLATIAALVFDNYLRVCSALEADSKVFKGELYNGTPGQSCSISINKDLLKLFIGPGQFITTENLPSTERFIHEIQQNNDCLRYRVVEDVLVIFNKNDEPSEEAEVSSLATQRSKHQNTRRHVVLKSRDKVSKDAGVDYAQKEREEKASAAAEEAARLRAVKASRAAKPTPPETPETSAPDKGRVVGPEARTSAKEGGGL